MAEVDVVAVVLLEGRVGGGDLFPLCYSRLSVSLNAPLGSLSAISLHQLTPASVPLASI